MHSKNIKKKTLRNTLLFKKQFLHLSILTSSKTDELISTPEALEQGPILVSRRVSKTSSEIVTEAWNKTTSHGKSNVRNQSLNRRRPTKPRKKLQKSSYNVGRQVPRNKSRRKYRPKNGRSRMRRKRKIFAGFNLLWVISSKIDKSNVETLSMMPRRHFRHNRQIITLNSKLPRLLLRYERPQLDLVPVAGRRNRDENKIKSLENSGRSAKRSRSRKKSSRNFVEVETVFKVDKAPKDG